MAQNHANAAIPSIRLKDTLARIERVWENYWELDFALKTFVDQRMTDKVEQWTRDATASIGRRSISISEVDGKSSVLVAQIVEGLRIALDYLIYGLSAFNDPSLDETRPQFVIAKDKEHFEVQAKDRLCYLTSDQQNFLERLQPYHGNELLALLRELSDHSKHRSLHLLMNAIQVEMYRGTEEDKEQYTGYSTYREGSNRVIFAKLSVPPTFQLHGQYNTMENLKNLIQHAEGDIIRAAFPLFRR